MRMLVNLKKRRFFIKRALAGASSLSLLPLLNIYSWKRHDVIIEFDQTVTFENYGILCTRFMNLEKFAPILKGFKNSGSLIHRQTSFSGNRARVSMLFSSEKAVQDWKAQLANNQIIFNHDQGIRIKYS